MYILLITLNFIMTMIFLFLNHPMSMGLILMIQTIIISLITGLYSYTFWFSYILFLIMIGGMLVLLIYMTSLTSNEIFNFSKNLLIMCLIILLLISMIYFNMDYMIFNSLFKNSNLIEMYNKNMLYSNENLSTLNLIYNKPNLMITLLLINYLLITLIAAVKITNIKYGPLRQKF